MLTALYVIIALLLLYSNIDELKEFLEYSCAEEDKVTIKIIIIFLTTFWPIVIIYNIMTYINYRYFNR